MQPACDGSASDISSLAQFVEPPTRSLMTTLDAPQSVCRNTEQRTANFHGAAENQRLDFETIFFSDPKFFELENFSAGQNWGPGFRWGD